MDDAASTKAHGDRGEAMALSYLESAGFRILTRNYRHLRKEIDLVAEGEGFLVFIEVKLRRGRGFGAPQEAVDAAKQAAIGAAARGFLRDTGLEGRASRFDVIAITEGRDGRATLEHIRDAFRPERFGPGRAPRR